MIKVAPSWIEASWPKIPGFNALTTLTAGGVSTGSFKGLNLGINTEDAASSVIANRQILQNALHLTRPIVWITQKHTNLVLNLDKVINFVGAAPIADAVFTGLKHSVCAVVTADCMPILLRSPKYHLVAAVHAGWRGVVNGVIDNTINALLKLTGSALLDDLEAWIGPSISATAFETGCDVVQKLLAKNASLINCCKQKTNASMQKYYVDLPMAARLILKQCGVSKVYGGDHCTFMEKERFYSYRRNNQTGRMASLIWMD